MVKINTTLHPVHPTAINSFLGAYIWVAYDQLQQFIMQDFTSHDACKCSYRFLAAIPLGFIFSTMFKDKIGLIIAFLLGTLSAQTLFKYGRRFVNQKINIEEHSENIPNELEQLQSINREEAE